MYIDTMYPSVFRPSFLDFEPTIWWGIDTKPEEIKDFEFQHSHNKWLAKKYEFRTNTLEIVDGKAAMSIRWNLKGGCYLHTNTMNPATSDFGEDERFVYFVMAYRHKDTWDGKPMLPRIREWIKYLEQMPSCPVQHIYARAMDCRPHRQRHLRLTGMMMDQKATTTRLDRVYRKYFGAEDWEYQDTAGIPFLRFRFTPKTPRK
jgi:hypothetical protein